MIAILALLCGIAPSPRALQENHDVSALARLEAPPLGLPPIGWPRDNPPSVAKIALGRKLFFDRRLSHNGTMSCGMCHIPEQGFTNNELAKPIGVEGRSLRRNAPTILNVAYFDSLFHDGRETALETQVISPLLAHNEMDNPSIGYLVDRISGLSDYGGLFEAAFGAGVSIERLGQAIATWERTLLSANSPFDRWRFGGEADAMTGQQKRGFDLFVGKAGCVACHRIGEKGALFTDGSYHNTGIGYMADGMAARRDPVSVEIAPGQRVLLDRAAVESVGRPQDSDLGRYEVTRDPADRWRFKTPSLRNVAVTAPYMHDGSMQTLAEVVEFYDRGGGVHGSLDPLIRPLGLGPGEREALVAFLEALTGDNLRSLIGDARSVAVGN